MFSSQVPTNTRFNPHTNKIFVLRPFGISSWYFSWSFCFFVWISMNNLIHIELIISTTPIKSKSISGLKRLVTGIFMIWSDEKTISTEAFWLNWTWHFRPFLVRFVLFRALFFPYAAELNQMNIHISWKKKLNQFWQFSGSVFSWFIHQFRNKWEKAHLLCVQNHFSFWIFYARRCDINKQ